MTRNASCVVPFCEHRQTTEKCGYFRFPKDVHRCKKWIQKIGNSDLLNLLVSYLSSNRFVCGCHFQENDFKGQHRKKLNNSAVPSIVDNQIKMLTDNEVSEFPLVNPKIVPTVAVRVTLSTAEFNKISSEISQKSCKVSSSSEAVNALSSVQDDSASYRRQTSYKISAIPSPSVFFCESNEYGELLTTNTSERVSISSASSIQEKENIPVQKFTSSKRSIAVLESCSSSDAKIHPSKPKKPRISAQIQQDPEVNSCCHIQNHDVIRRRRTANNSQENLGEAFKNLKKRLKVDGRLSRTAMLEIAEKRLRKLDEEITKLKKELVKRDCMYNLVQRQSDSLSLIEVTKKQDCSKD